MAALAACAGPDGAQPALPTAFPGRLSIDAVQATPPAGRLTGAIATRAPFATPLPATPRAGAPRITHDLMGKADCVYCHNSPTTLGMPPSHSLRTNAMCLGCHAVDSSVPQPTLRAAKHTLANKEACLLCHLGGENGARVVPASHAGRMNDSCRQCHQVQ